MFNTFEILIESLMLNYPLIWDWKVGCKAAYAISFENLAQREKFIQNFANKVVLIDEVMGVPRLKKKLAFVNSRGICCILPEGKMSQKTQEKVEILQSVAELGKYDDKEATAAVFFLYIGRTPPIIANQVRALRYNKLLEASPTLLRKPIVVPKVQEFGLIQAAIRNLSASKGEISTLEAASCFLYYRFSQARQKELQTLIALLNEEMQQHDNSGGDINAEEFVEVFLDLIFGYAEKGGFEEWFELPELTPDAVEKLQTAVFLKGDNLFISEQKFADICKPVSNDYTRKEILTALKVSGILQCYGKGYTVKMNYFNVFGVFERVLMLKLNLGELIATDGKPLRTYFY